MAQLNIFKSEFSYEDYGFSRTEILNICKKVESTKEIHTEKKETIGVSYKGNKLINEHLFTFSFISPVGTGGYKINVEETKNGKESFGGGVIMLSTYDLY